jgi:hypothetical protein
MFLHWIVLKIYFLMRYFYKHEGKIPSCFAPQNFDKAMEYTRWKQANSKIGKVLIGKYRVEVSTEDELLFKNDNDLLTIFRVDREEGIVLLTGNKQRTLERTANEVFCELVKRSISHITAPQKG